MLTAAELKIAKSKVRSHRSNPPVRRLEVLVDGSWHTINSRFHVSAKNRNKRGEIGRIEVEIYAPSGDFYDFSSGNGKPWVNVLNTVGRQVKLYEGWGSWVVCTFTGKISKYQMGKDGNTPNMIVLTCMNKLEEAKDVDAVPASFPAQTSVGEVGQGIIDQSGMDAELEVGAGAGGSSSDEMPSDPTDFPAPQWQSIGVLPKDINQQWNLKLPKGQYEGNSYWSASKYRTITYMRGLNMVAVYGSDGYVRLHDLTTNSIRFYEYGLDKATHTLNFPVASIGSEFYNNTGAMISDVTGERLFIVGNMRTQYISGAISSGSQYYRIYGLHDATLFDFKKKTVTKYTITNPILNTDVSAYKTNGHNTQVQLTLGSAGNKANIRTIKWVSENEIYYISPNSGKNALMKMEIDHVKKEITLVTVIESLMDKFTNREVIINGVQGYNKHLLLIPATGDVTFHIHGKINGKLIVASNNTVRYTTTPESTTYLNKGGVGIFTIDDNGAITFDLMTVFGNPSNSHTRLIDYHWINERYFMSNNGVWGIGDVVNKTLIRLKTGVVIYNPPMEQGSIRTSGTLLTFARGRYLTGMFTSAAGFPESAPENPQIWQIEINPYINDEAPDTGEYEDKQVTGNKPVFKELKELADQSGMGLYADNATGTYKLDYPLIKDTPDYIFEETVDVEELEWGMNPDAYDCVEIQYGVGISSGKYRIGSGNNKYMRISPMLTQSQAKQAAEIMYNPEYRHSVKFSSRAIPNMGINRTIHILGKDGKVRFKGVIIAFETDNTTDGSYKAQYEAVGHFMWTK